MRLTGPKWDTDYDPERLAYLPLLRVRKRDRPPSKEDLEDEVLDSRLDHSPLCFMSYLYSVPTPDLDLWELRAR